MNSRIDISAANTRETKLIISKIKQLDQQVKLLLAREIERESQIPGPDLAHSSDEAITDLNADLDPQLDQRPLRPVWSQCIVFRNRFNKIIELKKLAYLFIN